MMLRDRKMFLIYSAASYRLVFHCTKFLQQYCSILRYFSDITNIDFRSDPSEIVLMASNNSLMFVVRRMREFSLKKL